MAETRKVIAYILDRSDRILVFRHRDYPDAGLQVPAGTVKSDELPDAAVLREVRDETGLAIVTKPQLLGGFYYDMQFYGRRELQLRFVYRIRLEEEAPETWTHFETDHGKTKTIAFEFSWMYLNDPALQLEAGQGYLLGLL